MASHCDVAPQRLRRSLRKRTYAAEHEEDEEELDNNELMRRIFFLLKTKQDRTHNNR